MFHVKYVAMDVHKSTIVISVIDSKGHFESQAVLKTSARQITDFIKAQSGSIHLTFEEGTHSQWLFELLHPLVAELVVCNPRLSGSSKTSNKNDKLDSLNMARDLRAGHLKGVYHGSATTQTLKQLVHNYEAITGDGIRAMNRIKALYRSRALEYSGRDVYYQRNRIQWLEKLKEPGLRMRAEFLFDQLDHLRALKRQAQKAMIKEASRHPAFKPLCSIAGLGPVRVAQIMAAVISPFRFRTKRPFWTYCGLAVVTRSSSDYEIKGNSLIRKHKQVQTRGLNRNYNRRLKNVFKSAALQALKDEEVSRIYRRLIERGTRPEMARLTIARKLAAVKLAIYSSTLACWLAVLVKNRAINENALRRNTEGPLEDLSDHFVMMLSNNVEASLRSWRYGPLIKESFRSAYLNLTDRERLIMRLHYEKGMKFLEIAKLLGETGSTITRHFQALHQKLHRDIVSSLKSRHKLSEAAIEECLEELIETRQYSIPDLIGSD